jgi:PBSX family phage terminase large subunit
MEKVISDIRKFSKAQQFIDAILQQKYTVICFGGAVRGGKSFNATTGLTLLHKLFPGSRSAIVRDTLETLRRNMLPTCQKAIPKLFIKNYNRSNYNWTFKNGSEMFFFAENFAQDKEYKRWNGLEVNFILLEQAEELEYSTFEKALERVGSYMIPSGQQPKSLIIITVNPNQGWTKELFHDKWKDGTLDEKHLYIPSLITDNPHIDEDYKNSLKQLKKINPIKYQRFVEGDWDIMEEIQGAFWKNFKYDTHVVEDIEIDTDKPLHISFDENVHPYPALSVWQIHDNPDMLISEYDSAGKLKMAYKDGKKVIQIKEFALKHPRNKLRIVASEFIKWAKSIGFKDNTKLEKGVNYFTMLRDELDKAFVTRIKKPVKNPPVALSAEFINAIYGYNFGGLAIEINKDCSKSINDYMFAIEDSDGTMLKQKTRDPKTGLTYEVIGHFSDTKRYFICEVFKKEFEKFSKKEIVAKRTTGKQRREKHY